MKGKCLSCLVAISSMLSGCAGGPGVEPTAVPAAAAPEPQPPPPPEEATAPGPVETWAPVLDSEREWIDAVKARLPSSWASYEPDPHVVLLYDRKVKRDRIREMGAEVLRLLKDAAVPAFPPAGPLDRVFLVRVCRDAGQFAMYGGSPGSAGYWSPRDGESVTFEDVSARKDTLRAVRYVAMMQYLHLSGAPGTHPWFRAGVSAAFSEPGTGRSRKPHPWWSGRAREAARAGRTFPLRDLLRLEDLSRGDEHDLRAKCWSLAWLLLETRNSPWSGALGRYFAAHRDRLAALASAPSSPPHRAFFPEETLAAAREAGLQAAFGSLEERDWTRLEKEWNRAR